MVDEICLSRPVVTVVAHSLLVAEKALLHTTRLHRARFCGPQSLGVFTVSGRRTVAWKYAIHQVCHDRWRVSPAIILAYMYFLLLCNSYGWVTGFNDDIPPLFPIHHWYLEFFVSRFSPVFHDLFRKRSPCWPLPAFPSILFPSVIIVSHYKS